MIPGAGGTQRLARLVGEGQAMRLVLTGEPISGAEAGRIGLVEFVVPKAELAARTESLAHSIARRAPIALEAAKELVKAAAKSTLQGGLMHEIALSTLCFATEDKEEAVTAFMEKREPEFKAR
jgi:enoyl-CoA hydratase